MQYIYNIYIVLTTVCPFTNCAFFYNTLQGRDATPYLERNRVGRDAIDSAAALTDMGKYLFRERRLPVYDIAVAITKWVHPVPQRGHPVMRRILLFLQILEAATNSRSSSNTLSFSYSLDSLSSIIYKKT